MSGVTPALFATIPIKRRSRIPHGNGVLTLESTPGFTIDPMHTHIRHVVVAFIFVASVSSAMLAQHSPMPTGMTHQEHLTQIQQDLDLKKRGGVVMGFDQDKTTHHFRLYETGGAIEVAANDPADETTLGQVRTHLKEIASAFARGDFAKPFATHAEVPPGSGRCRSGERLSRSAMKRRRRVGGFVSPRPMPKQRRLSTSS